ncbi:MAG: hypothetical protein ACREBH_03450 [Candidatus Micrarchaeaceae archaeon]
MSLMQKAKTYFNGTAREMMTAKTSIHDNQLNKLVHTDNIDARIDVIIAVAKNVHASGRTLEAVAGVGILREKYELLEPVICHGNVNVETLLRVHEHLNNIVETAYASGNPREIDGAAYIDDLLEKTSNKQQEIRNRQKKAKESKRLMLERMARH